MEGGGVENLEKTDRSTNLGWNDVLSLWRRGMGLTCGDSVMEPATGILFLFNIAWVLEFTFGF